MTNLSSLISVIIPVYNVKRYLKRCIKSVINQDYKNIEILLVDDGSTDRSGDICDRYTEKDIRIKVFHIENSGVGAARNTGLNNAQGKYICFVDSDDFIPKNALSKLYQSITENKSDLVCGAWTKITALKTVQNNYEAVTFSTSDKEALAGYLNVEEVNGPVAKLYKRDLIEKFDLHFNKEMKIGEDALFNYQYIKHCRHLSVCSNNVYYYNKLNVTSSTHTFYDKFSRCSFDCAVAQADNIISDDVKFNHPLVQKIFCTRFLSSIDYINYYNPIKKTDYLLEAYSLFCDKLDLSVVDKNDNGIFSRTEKLVSLFKDGRVGEIHCDTVLNNNSFKKTLKIRILNIIGKIKYIVIGMKKL